MAAEGREAAILGPNDFHAGYMSYLTPVRKGERLVVKAEFPHCRYVSFTIYDQDFMIADTLYDFDVIPSKGVNPFQPGADRSGEWLGEYELQVLMEDPPPKEDREPNTLYAGRAFDGSPNRSMILAYRMYLPDKGYGFEDGHPLAVYGGVEPGFVQLYDKHGKPYCPGDAIRKVHLLKVFSAGIRKNLKKLMNPKLFLGDPRDPPLWMNNASRENQRDSTYVPNEETAYIAATVSSRFGELLVLRWKAARTPEETYHGKPFPEDYDMRYWSLSFAPIARGEGLGVVTKMTMADVQAPVLPDGTRQVVVGIGGMERPDSVPAEMWAGVKIENGFIIMRNIQVNPEYEGEFGKLPMGPVAPEFDRHTPGGVYCSIKQFEQNPDIGLTRKELIK